MVDHLAIQRADVAVKTTTFYDTVLAPLGGRLFHPAPRGSKRVDSGLVLLGRAADGFKLWLGLAAGLALSGGRFRRRAALKGAKTRTMPLHPVVARVML